MQFDSLKYFYDAARLQSMTAAAELNHVSRPAISQAIKKLESDLQVQLLHHRKRGFELTAAGQRVQQTAGQVFDSVATLRSIAVGAASTELSGSLRIGMARALTTYRVDYALAELRLNHPNVLPRLRLHNSELLLDQLESRELDLAVIISDEMRAGLISETLSEGAFVLLRPKSLPPSKVCYALSERRPETDALRREYQRRFQRDLPVFAEVPSWDTIWNWIKKGHCGGLVPDLFLERSTSKQSQVATVIKDVYPYRVNVYMRDSQKMNPVNLAMVERLRKSFAKVRP